MKNYNFEINDVRCLINIINVILVIGYDLKIAWLGVVVALFGIIKDIIKDRHLNGFLMHLSTIILNLYLIFGIGGWNV